ncbi:MAG: DUF92 domain-containing protein [Balneolaceae bacterium]
MDRLANYVFGLLIIYLFIIEGKADDHIQILTGFFLSVMLAYLSFLANWLTLDATRSVIVLGTITFGFGGWIFAFAIIFFFVSSSLLTKRRREKGFIDPEKRHIHHDLQKRRDGYQVWANGFWMAIFITGWFLFEVDAFFIAAFAVVATATADTWATELGSINPGKTLKITNYQPVNPGTDGGISFKGTAAAASGSAVIGAFMLFLNVEFTSFLFLIVMVSGFLGCIADSYLGAFLLNKKLDGSTPANFSENPDSFKNSVVNWLSTGIGGITAFIFTQFFHL